MADTRQIKGLSQWRWREAKRAGRWVTQRKVDIDVLESFDVSSPAELMKRIQEAGLEEGRIEITHDEQADWGSCRYSLQLSGWRDATEDELGAEWDRVIEERKQRDEWDRRQAEDLKRRRPELFE